MKSRLLVLLVLATMFLAACGGETTEPGGNDTGATVPAGDDDNATGDGQADPGDSGVSDEGAGDSEGAAPEASGPLAENTIRIGDQTWERTLPMTTGQCFLYEDDGNLPTSGNVWGTLDGDDDLRFSASYGQDGTFEAEVSNNQDMYWGSGERFAQEDLEIELDFDTLTISGSGTFISLTSGDRAMGSFLFVCEPEE